MKISGPAFTELREQASYFRYRSLHARTEAGYFPLADEYGNSWVEVSRVFEKVAEHLEKMIQKAETP